MSQQNELMETQRNMFGINDKLGLTVEHDNEAWPTAVLSNDERVVITSEDFELQIIQPGAVQTRKELAPNIGKILIKNMDEFRDEMWLIPITLIGYQYRNYSDFQAGQKNELLCWSNNGLEPAPRVQNPCSAQCARLVESRGDVRLVPVCGEAVWNGDRRPSCRLSVRLAFFDLESKIPVQLELHGTGMSAWNNLRSSRRTACNVAKLKGLSISNYVVHLLTQHNGTYIKPEMDFVLAPEKFGDISRYQPLVAYYLNTLYSAKNPEPGVEEPKVSTDVDEVFGSDTEGLASFDM